MQATAQHEMRNPLNAMLSMQELMKCHISAEGQKFLDVSISSCKLLLFLVNDMIDFHLIKTNNELEIDYRSFDVRLCIGSIMDLLKAKTTDGIELLTEILPSVHKNICQDG